MTAGTPDRLPANAGNGSLARILACVRTRRARPYTRPQGSPPLSWLPLRLHARPAVHSPAYTIARPPTQPLARPTACSPAARPPTRSPALPTGRLPAHAPPYAPALLLALGAERFTRIEARLDGFGWFDRKGRVDQLWAGLAPREPLAALHARLDRLCVRAGFEPEARK